MTFAPLGDSAVVVTLGAAIDESTLVRVRALAAAVERRANAGIVEVVPAYTTVTVVYEARQAPLSEVTSFERVCRLIGECMAETERSWPGLVAASLGGAGAGEARPVVEIPVCYGGELGPDLEAVAQHTGLAVGQISALHSGADYVVQAVGFAPGFGYLGGLPESLRTPRRPTPRQSVPAGSVGIGWAQTGVYPLATPGGWQLIGRTPLAMFDARLNPPARLRVGDRVKFRAITREEFAAWK